MRRKGIIIMEVRLLLKHRSAVKAASALLALPRWDDAFLEGKGAFMEFQM